MSVNEITSKYRPRKDIILRDGEVPLTWWRRIDNWGDAISPWLVHKLTGINARSVVEPPSTCTKLIKQPHYIAIGSMLLYVRPTSIVWGTGANSTEPFRKMKTLGAGHHSEQAKYHSVRGPLTRSLVASAGGHCPEVYGDPALLVPYLFDKTREDIPKTHKIGVIIRCNDWAWKDAVPGDGVKLIDLKTTDVEKTLIDILSCEKIVSSALHGLIISDAFNIPNAWLWTPKVTGASCSASGRFKYMDYFMSVDKIRDRHMYKIKNVPGALDASNLEKHFNFDDRPINFNYEDIMDACPFMERIA